MSSGEPKAYLLIYYIAGPIVPPFPSRLYPFLARLNGPFLFYRAVIKPLPSSGQTQLNALLPNPVALLIGP